VRSLASNSVTYTMRPEGAWLIPDDADPIHLHAGTSTADRIVQNDRRATYRLFNSDTDLDIVTGFEGLSP
jgi:hypothetical protein